MAYELKRNENVDTERNLTKLWYTRTLKTERHEKVSSSRFEHAQIFVTLAVGGQWEDPLPRVHFPPSVRIALLSCQFWPTTCCGSS